MISRTEWWTTTQPQNYTGSLGFTWANRNRASLGSYIIFMGPLYRDPPAIQLDRFHSPLHAYVLKLTTHCYSFTWPQNMLLLSTESITWTDPRMCNSPNQFRQMYHLNDHLNFGLLDDDSIATMLTRYFFSNVGPIKDCNIFVKWKISPTEFPPQKKFRSSLSLSLCVGFGSATVSPFEF